MWCLVRCTFSDLAGWAAPRLSGSYWGRSFAVLPKPGILESAGSPEAATMVNRGASVYILHERDLESIVEGIVLDNAQGHPKMVRDSEECSSSSPVTERPRATALHVDEPKPTPGAHPRLPWQMTRSNAAAAVAPAYQIAEDREVAASGPVPADTLRQGA
ncbi:hypothetical protein B0T26DRAFT_798416 [Lasiosphaeria miniovina]|uniref:Uncharacterized protein n=1 Tax=Lasiosphaeria miniovina TaxID=1954250 RepID=A0AA40BIC1_9PEZI|nr:uncharacterized protein B0T26DRAFT_798416 [Lasiosphaeria miniovina]KAK0734618.1 hypothetical protein B0T26DRAFT_798416 [Lasiosphaeria miniovina]